MTPDETPAAEAYDRGRPSYPAEAVLWLTGRGRATVLDLGAGTGKMSGPLVEAGHQVIATDPSLEMLTVLRRHLPRVPAVAAVAEQVPLPSRSLDVAVGAQSFHRFDHERALPEIARVLRPGGVLGLVWNRPDTSVPWVRRLARLVGEQEKADDLALPLRRSDDFGLVEEQTFRHWHELREDSLLDLVRSRSNVALMGQDERESLLESVRALYADYGRGHAGMLLPYVAHCFRAVVTHRFPPPPVGPPRVETARSEDSGDEEVIGLERGTFATRQAPVSPGSPDDPDPVLIDFR